MAIVIEEIAKYLKGAKLPQSTEKEICWYIDGDRPEVAMQIVTHSSFSIHDFLDPSRIVFGITYLRKEPSRIKPSYPEFNINFNPMTTSSQLAA